MPLDIYLHLKLGNSAHGSAILLIGLEKYSISALSAVRYLLATVKESIAQYRVVTKPARHIRYAGDVVRDLGGIAIESSVLMPALGSIDLNMRRSKCVKFAASLWQRVVGSIVLTNVWAKHIVFVILGRLIQTGEGDPSLIMELIGMRLEK